MATHRYLGFLRVKRKRSAAILFPFSVEQDFDVDVSPLLQRAGPALMMSKDWGTRRELQRRPVSGAVVMPTSAGRPQGFDGHGKTFSHAEFDLSPYPLTAQSLAQIVRLEKGVRCGQEVLSPAS